MVKSDECVAGLWQEAPLPGLCLILPSFPLQKRVDETPDRLIRGEGGGLIHTTGLNILADSAPMSKQQPRSIKLSLQLREDAEQRNFRLGVVEVKR